MPLADRWFPALVLLAASAAPAAAFTPVTSLAKDLAIEGAWVREAPPGARVMAGYMTVKNHGKRALTLAGVTSPLFGQVEMHVLLKQGDRVTMKRVSSFALPPGGELKLAPGGNHLMMLEPKHPLKAGDEVPFVLRFGPAGILAVKTRVRRG